jgi:hypothetical protein
MQHTSRINVGLRRAVAWLNRGRGLAEQNVIVDVSDGQ